MHQSLNLRRVFAPRLGALLEMIQVCTYHGLGLVHPAQTHAHTNTHTHTAHTLHSTESANQDSCKPTVRAPRWWPRVGGTLKSEPNRVLVSLSLSLTPSLSLEPKSRILRWWPMCAHTQRRPQNSLSSAHSAAEALRGGAHMWTRARVWARLTRREG
jgi:hypothetical protein